jgi:hypothetical protein
MRHGLLLALSLLLITGCKKASESRVTATPIDQSLRAFMGIRTVNMDFELPEKDSAYYPVVVGFANGKEVLFSKGPVLTTGLKSTKENPHRGNLQLMWRQLDDNTIEKAALVMDGNSRDLTAAYPYWEKFSAGGGWRSVDLQENLSYKGVHILGIVSSPAAEQVGPQLSPDTSNLAQAARYYVVIGIVTGGDADDMLRRFHSTGDE